MNSNMTLTCETCEQDTDCRVGYSNRRIQPLSFSCPHCGSQMYITLDISRAPASDFKFKACRPAAKQYAPFDGSNPFVGLHLDFPVDFGKYVMGETPFMVAMKQIEEAVGADNAIEAIQFHSGRLNQLNYFHDRSEEIRTIIRLYSGKNKQLFKKRVAGFLNKSQGSSLRPEDVNASLYQFVTFVFLPFVNFQEVSEVVHGFSDLMGHLPKQPLSNFVEMLVTTNFLQTLQKDCLKIYPDIYDAEMPMRPAFYLDLIPSYERAKFAGRVSTEDFQSYKDLYKDIVEVFSRQLVLLAGVNNIIHRGDSNSFKLKDGAALSSLEKFSNKSFSERFKYLDDCWYNLDNDAIDAGVRNAIAHNNVQYNESTQEITYYPDGGGLQQSTGITIYFLDFMRMILVLFREMNNLHHLVKCLFYYEFLIRSKAPPKGSAS